MIQMTTRAGKAGSLFGEWIDMETEKIELLLKMYSTISPDSLKDGE